VNREKAKDIREAYCESRYGYSKDVIEDGRTISYWFPPQPNELGSCQILGGGHDSGVRVLFVDGTVKTFSDEKSISDIKAMSRIKE